MKKSQPKWTLPKKKGNFLKKLYLQGIDPKKEGSRLC